MNEAFNFLVAGLIFAGSVFFNVAAHADEQQPQQQQQQATDAQDDDDC